MITDTSFLVGSVEPMLLAAVACPSWCTQPAGHGTGDSEILRQRELIRHHWGAEQVVVEQPVYGGTPVTAQLSQYGAIAMNGEDTVTVEPASVLVSPLPEFGLTAAEARRLADALQELADQIGQAGRAVSS